MPTTSSARQMEGLEEAAGGTAVSKKGTSSANSRAARVIRLVQEGLRSQDGLACSDSDGYVAITKLMRIKPDLQRETFGSTRAIVNAIDYQAGVGVRLDKSHRRIRLQTNEELVRAVAERDIELSASGIHIEAFIASPELQPCVHKMRDPRRFIQTALSDPSSAAVLRNSMIVRRPRDMQLRRAAEDLFADEHLAHDSRLRSKIAECAGGAVPLTWLCARYNDRLGVAPSLGARASEVSAAELCNALSSSDVLRVDSRRLTVCRRKPFAPPSSSVADEPQPAHVNGTGASSASGSGKEARVAAQLRQLLDFYFEPFTLQHNRYLLDLVSRRVGPAEENGPWVAEALLDFTCDLQDLLGLGRISSVLTKGKIPPRAVMAQHQEFEQLKHLSLLDDGRLQLKTPLEIRSFVPAEGASVEVINQTTRYLAAAREQRGEAPEGTVSVVSYCVAELLADTTADAVQRDARVKRQLVMHHADLVCLQGLDTHGRGESLATTLAEDGYGFASTRWSGDANAIFWDRSRWEHVGTFERGAALAVDLSLIEDSRVKVRAVCLRPSLPHRNLEQHEKDIESLYKPPGGGPVIVCADMSLLGGASGSTIVQELGQMLSVTQEVLGEEIAAPEAIAPTDSKNACSKDGPLPLRSGINGLNKLRCPDAVLFQDLAPVVALSGHTEGYLATMAPEEVAKQFPAYRLPIVAAFDWRFCACAHQCATFCASS